ncbi:hypothetical protein A2678_01440 [Candidatus Kaiserbacteria bacterium RIFCSPHIGHO2_01_FULL_53_31]|uniref:Uncharacterized protein n=1 Tax=Candidatus Kaiserbacteria bacterium RIFCSPHIGHO2_01_FULL_53_31 TaxID=1798481 RepID=A0A1F6CGB2_9BACT|nr:MAG: hypothetical protein A2678_01440 [Candidatus Kaiserbacteria bacterium RIFCSPHIGHO2_01_FULL_53_31]
MLLRKKNKITNEIKKSYPHIIFFRRAKSFLRAIITPVRSTYQPSFLIRKNTMAKKRKAAKKTAKKATKRKATKRKAGKKRR